MINNVNIQQYPIDKYYNMIGAVFQDFKLLSFTMRENILLNNKEDCIKFEQVINQGGLRNKIDSLTKGAEIVINKEFDSNGIEFSDGEAQKLAIARTLYKNSPILILDVNCSTLLRSA